MKNFLHELARAMSNTTSHNSIQRQAIVSRLMLDAMAVGVLVNTPSGTFTVSIPVEGTALKEGGYVPVPLNWDIEVTVVSGCVMHGRSWPAGRWHYDSETKQPYEVSHADQWLRDSRCDPGYKA